MKMKNRADVVIIGGGAIGCSIAYNLAKKGFKDVVLLEKRFLAAGATGACGSGFRQQWGTEVNIRLARESCKLFKTLNEELDYLDIEFVQKGYLLCAYSAEQDKMLHANMELQHKLGVPSQRLTPSEAKELVPYLNTEELTAGYYCKEDGHANPFKTTYSYAQAAKRLHAEINSYTEVTGIESQKNKIVAVETNKGKIYTERVINACGPLCSQIGRMIGIEHPVKPKRVEKLVTEAMEKTVGPMIQSFRHSSSCQQVPHGGFLMGFSRVDEPYCVNRRHSWQFLEETAKKIIPQLPVLKDLRVIRQFADHYDVSPDGQPVIGPVPEIDNYYLAVGCGKGFMMAPMIGQLIAEYLNGETTTLPLEPYSTERFAKGELIEEPAVV